MESTANAKPLTSALTSIDSQQPIYVHHYRCIYTGAHLPHMTLYIYILSRTGTQTIPTHRHIHPPTRSQGSRLEALESLGRPEDFWLEDI